MQLTHDPENREPQAILLDPAVWCDGCHRMRRASGLHGGLCWVCRGDEEPKDLTPITKEELEAEIHVHYNLSGSWTVKRSDWNGTEDEWRDLVRALNDELDPKKADEIYEDAAERFGWDAESHCYSPEVDLTLRSPARLKAAS